MSVECSVFDDNYLGLGVQGQRWTSRQPDPWYGCACVSPGCQNGKRPCCRWCTQRRDCLSPHPAPLARTSGVRASSFTGRLLPPPLWHHPVRSTQRVDKGLSVWGLDFWGLEFGVWGLGFGVWGLGFGVWGLAIPGYSCLLSAPRLKVRSETAGERQGWINCETRPRRSETSCKYPSSPLPPLKVTG